MKTIIITLIIILFSSVSHTQQEKFNRDFEVQKFVERGGKVEETYQNIYKLTYRDGTNRVFNFNSAPTQNEFANAIDTTIINVWEIDTTLYSNKFKFWQRVDLVNSWEEVVPIDDINQNGLTELYGITRYTWPFGGQVDILEQDAQGIFHKVHSYDSTSIFVQGIGDVNSDGIKEVHLRTTDTLNGKFYSADSLGALPTNFDFVFYYYPNQIGDETIGDFDKNNITDCVFVDGSNPSRVIISEFRDSINNFKTLFEMPTEGDVPSGFAIGDFDQDDKTELVFGTVLQNVFVVETSDTNQYSIVWEGSVPTYNAYMNTKTDDIDENGKPEFWIGGRDFGDNISKFFCYESDGDNSYIPVATIELRYLVSLYTAYIQAVDIDNDGKEELIINMGNYLLILKFAGKPNKHNYKLWYAKVNELTQPGASILPSTIFDFNEDGKKDILLSLDLYDAPNISYILIQDSVTSVLDENLQILNQFDIQQNFPNPFNSFSQIKIISGFNSIINISIYNILGKEIRTLLEKELPAGEYSIEWDGKDSNGNVLNSGVYFIRMEANGFQKTIKSILLK